MEVTKHLDQSWKEVTDIVVYGFGKQGKTYIDKLRKEFHVAYIIDNGISGECRDYCNIPIISFEEYKQLKQNYKIIICAAGKAYESIREGLLESGKIEYKDFIDVDVFLLEWFWRYRGELHLGRISTSVTERCTLKCKNCSMYMPYFSNPRDFTYKELCNNMDLLLSIVDSLAAVLVVGGEPFLLPELANYLEYLALTYGERIGQIIVVTNATIKPDDPILKIMKKYNISVRISDYTHAVPYKKRLQEVIDKLDEFEIDYQIPDFGEWVDMGRPDENICIGKTAEEVREHMLQCNVSCGFLCEEKFYYCCRLWSAEGAFGYKLYEGDYLSLKELTEDIVKGKEKLMNYYIGNLDQGYGRYCQICRGYDQGIPVKSAEQI